MSPADNLQTVKNTLWTFGAEGKGTRQRNAYAPTAFLEAWRQ